jgi:hypothetical protein
MRAISIPVTFALVLASLPAANAADSPSARRGATDAAERVQEGNVQQWIEYYERERASAAQPRRPETPPPTPTTRDKPPAKP